MEFYAPGLPIGRFPAIKAATYEGAQTNRLNERHWTIGKQLADPTPEQRETLRNRTRYEVANNALLEGMIETYARDLVGSGPHPTFREFGQDGKQLKTDWELWVGEQLIAPLFKTIARAYLIDGEVFILWTDEPPYVRVIEPERIYSNDIAMISPIGMRYVDGIPIPQYNSGEIILEGIRYVDGVPVEYIVDGEKRYPADVMTHLYKQQYPNQRRGVPRPAPSLDMFAFIRRLNVAAIASYETAAKIAMVLYTKMIAGQAAEPFETVDIVAGQALTLPEGYELGQVQAEHPAATHREVVAMYVGEAARCFPMPLNKALGTSQDSNFASGSLDNIDYERAIESDQVLLQAGLVNRLTGLFLMLQARPIQRLFIGWDAIPHLNPEKQFAAIQTKLDMRLTSRTREAAKLGEDWNEIQEELEREEQRIQASSVSQQPGGNVENSDNAQAIPNAGDSSEPTANPS